MAVVVDHDQAVVGFPQRERDPVVAREPGEVVPQLLLAARRRDDEEVVVGPFVRCVVAVCHRPDRDESDRTLVRAEALGQLAGERAVLVGLHSESVGNGTRRPLPTRHTPGKLGLTVS